MGGPVGLAPEAYYSQAAFKSEQEEIFRKTWQFVGLREQLAEHGQWLCVEVGGHSVVVQNFSGGLHAFHNVCAHRQSRLRQVDACGVGPLRCPYHGWTYDEDGIASGIPARREFDAALRDKPAPRLDRWRVESLGPFVFVNACERAESLSAGLGQLSARIAAVAESAETVVATGSFVIEANWKVIVENTVENYHVHQVHGATLGKHALTEIETSFSGVHSSSRFTTETSQRVLRAIDIAFPGRALASDYYEHFLLFPNTLLTHVYGAFFMLIRVEPISPTRSNFRSTILTTRSGACSPEALSVRKLLVDSNVAFIWKSYREDAPICEGVQQGLREARSSAIFGDREVRIREFQRAYRAVLDGSQQ